MIFTEKHEAPHDEEEQGPFFMAQTKQNFVKANRNWVTVCVWIIYHIHAIFKQPVSALGTCYLNIAYNILFVCLVRR